MHEEGRRTWQRVTRWVESPWSVAVAAVAAVLLRLPGLTRPLRADEAGFLLVARSWEPGPGTLYGTYFVDRPPPLIALFGAADAVGGPLAVRVLGALGCAVLVLLAAHAARVLAGPQAVGWTAIAVAALTATPLINAVAVKGELLAAPLVLGGCLVALAALRRRSAWLALAAGCLAALPLGLKQNLAGALVFAAVLLLTAVVRDRLPLRAGLGLGAAGLVGAALPVLATVAWAEAAGPGAGVLWETVIGFRSEAAGVLASTNTSAPTRRAIGLVNLALLSGMLPVLVLFVARLRPLLAVAPEATVATAALLTLDVATVAAGGSYWADYLFTLLPATALALALLLGREGRSGRAARSVAGWAAVSCLVALVCWAVWNGTGRQEFDERDTGVAIARAADPGDTLTVFGGRADLQVASGLPSPYEHLWSLPMRTRDADLAELRSLVAGPEAPTWIVEWVPFSTWNPQAGSRLAELVEERYVRHGTGCGGRPVWLRRDAARPLVLPDCA